MLESWDSRSQQRIPEVIWNEALTRVRGEFEEMPCLRVTPRQAELLFGLSEPVAHWVLKCLVRDGFLEQTRGGEYFRRGAAP